MGGHGDPPENYPDKGQPPHVAARQVGRSSLPRLTAAMQWQGILSPGEAGSAVAALRRGDPYGGSEAVAHYGGPEKLVRDSFRNRNLSRG